MAVMTTARATVTVSKRKSAADAADAKPGEKR